jgi:urease accessory protein
MIIRHTIIMTIITMMSIASTSIITVIPMLMTTSRPADFSLPDRAGAALSADEAAALYRLMTWLSPAFPVGAFSYSSGIEWVVEAGDIVDVTTLQDWLSAMLTDGPGFCDGVFLAHAHRAASTADDATLRDVAELAAAFAPSRERHLETSAQGRAFVEIARSAWNCDGLDRLTAACDGAIVYPVAVGIVSAAHAIPLGQTDSQRALAALEPVVVATGKRALGATLDDLGSATFRADLASMHHEMQYTRLFRS